MHLTCSKGWQTTFSPTALPAGRTLLEASQSLDLFAVVTSVQSSAAVTQCAWLSKLRKLAIPKFTSKSQIVFFSF